MKKSINLIAGLILLIVMTSLIISQTDESEIVLFKKKMYNTILMDIDKNSELKKNLPKYFDIVAVPTCNVSIKQLTEKNNESAIEIMIDSSLGYGFIKDHNKVLIVANKINSSYSFLSNELIAPHAKNIDMIENAMHYSANPFFVYFLKDEKYWQDVIGLFSNGKISFIDVDLHIYSDFETIIKHRYGSVEKYLELSEDSKFKERLKSKIDDIEEAKAIVKNDYIKLLNHFPQDTLDVFNLFILEMDSITKLTEDQKAIVKQKVFIRISKYQLNTYTGCGIPFYGEDISYEVQSVLTKNQYSKYIAQRALNSWLATQASNRVYTYFKREKGIPEDSIKSSYKREVFGK